MSNRKWQLAAFAGLLALCAASLAVAFEDKKDKKADDKKTDAKAEDKAGGGVKIGQDAPDFTLKNTAGEEIKLSDYKDKVVVLQWVNKECPWCRKSNDVVKELYKKWTEKGVVWLAIDSTNWAKADENAKYAEEHKLPYKQLMDNDGTVGKAYGAQTTPHIFIIDKGKVVYNGALHNDQQGTKPQAEKRNYVDEALTAIMDGKPVPVAETKPWGCSVKYKKD